MFGSMQGGAKAYAKVGVESGVAAASPHKLTAMLFDGAMLAVSAAQQQLKSGNIAGRGQSISQAIMIIESGLRASLDKNVGGQIAQNLDALYEYMGNRLLLANSKSQPEPLEEVHRLLNELKGAWDAIRVPAPGAQAAAEQPAPVYDSLAPRTSRLMKA